MTASERSRLKLCIRGAVQGVGFRPFIFRLAGELGLGGWVSNTAQGVFLEVEGPRSELEKFLLRLESEKPPHSFIQSLEASWLDAVGYARFEIRESEPGGSKTALVLPDIATCADCLGEIFDPANRRYFYPFTNCAHCGPRFSIIESLPYDRANTSMKKFAMCPQCEAEYNDPRDRRFHAQPNACPNCGPHLELWPSGPAGREQNAAGLHDFRNQPRSAERSHEALQAAAEAIRRGEVVAVKGLGGFHLMVDARNDEAVRRLRERKHREEKPLALMFPSFDSIKAACEVSVMEERLLCSSEAPIVLLRRRNSQLSTLNFQLAAGLAPGNPNLGVMLPYAPLHHLLVSLLNFPVVATSGNLRDEPMCIDEHEAMDRLAGIADWFLVHNRPIVRHVDDSLVRVMIGREMVLRRARGYAPLPVQMRKAEGRMMNERSALPDPGATVLAVGAHLKNAVALAVGSQVFISQHIGDLETDQAYEAFRRVIADFEHLYETTPAIVAADAHPDYLSTKYAQEMGRDALPRVQAERQLGPTVPEAESLRYVSVQHHVAHVLSCMAENELEPPVLGVSWDGTGYGLDGTIWGGEFFLVTDTAYQRVAHLRPFRLPGGDKAVREPRRTALGLLYELFGDAAFEMTSLPPFRGLEKTGIATLRNMLGRGLNSPRTSSVGRLFDAVAALVGLRQQTRFEGQAAMELEFALDGIDTDESYPMPIADCGGRDDMTVQAASPLSRSAHHASWILEWSAMVEAILADLKRGLAIGGISARFHNALAEAIVAVARRVGQNRVVLSGGCFQNRYLTERAVRRLEAEGFRPYWHQRVPPNDGGIALGQVMAARREAACGAPGKTAGE